VQQGNQKLFRFVVATFFIFEIISVRASGSELLEAAQRNNTETVLTLLAEGINVNASQADGATALHWAAHWNEISVAQQLIDAGAVVSAVNEFGLTPLSMACRNGSATMVSILLASGADATAAQPSGETVLMTCARTGSREAVEQLLAGGANPDAMEERSGQTALMWAAAEGHSAVIHALIEAGADVNASSHGNFTALLFAARAGALDVSRHLLGAGAEVNVATTVGHSALLIAAASLDAITGSDYRLVVESSDHEALGLLLLEHGADVAQADQYGMTPLHYVVEMGKPVLLNALLGKNANPNAQLTEGLPFRRGDYVGRGAYNGASPFWLAARLGETGMMESLLAAGADPELSSAFGVTPLLVAAGLTQSDARMVAEEKLLAAVKMLVVDVGVDINAVDRNGQTAIHGAANVSGNRLIEFLVDHGVDPMALDNRGNTPLDVARRTQRPRPITAALIQELAAQ